MGAVAAQVPCVRQQIRHVPKYIQSHCLKDEAVDYLEFGVFRGASISKWSEINTHPLSRFFGFDCFEGLPEDWVAISGTGPRGSYSAGGKIPTSSDGRVRFVKGQFAKTLPGFLRTFQSSSRLIVHNDADLFSSTLYVLTKIDSVVEPGTVVIFDEFSNPLHEWKAFRGVHVQLWALI